MNRLALLKSIASCIAILLLYGLTGTTPIPAEELAASDRAAVVVVPEETDELLANPGIGWQTFLRTSRQDKNLPPWLPSSMHYARWGWGRLEPQPGQLNTEFLDRVLAETRESNQTLAFRVMCCSTYAKNPYHPRWLAEVGGKVVEADHRGEGPFPIPDLDDPTTLERHLDFIKRLGERYDGHPDIDHVDLGSIGWWGEWHLSGSSKFKLPTAENRKRVVDAYLAAFKRTPLVMLIGGGEHLSYACSRGTGWRADCLGDLGGFSKNWCHMRIGYPGWFKQAGISEAWKTAPVAWETCWDMRKWVDEGWSLRYIFNYALACHGSVINNKSAPLPPGEQVRPELERFLRRLGYRLVLCELKHPPRAAAGAELTVAMKWRNVGSAPCYRPYRVALRLTDAAGTHHVFVGKEEVNRWMPGSVELFTEDFLREPPDLPPGPIVAVNQRIALPADLPPGTYTVAVGVVAAEASAVPARTEGSGSPGHSLKNVAATGPMPVVRLGIKGRANDGWYPLSKIAIGR